MRREALLAAGLGLALGASCRKAEPDEIVTPPRQTASPPPVSGGGGSGAVGGGGVTGGSANNTGGQAGDAPGSGGSGAGPSSISCETAVEVVEGPFTKAKLLESAASCAMSHYCRFAGDAERLRDATAALAAERSEANAAAAKAAWRAALASWEWAEVFAFGPAASAPVGQDYRFLIYAWPLESRCKVDEQTVSRFYATPRFFGTPVESVVTGRSLTAIEYLLYYTGADNGCNLYSTINSSGTWAALSADDRVLYKAEYAAAAARDVLASVTALLAAWSPDGGNFRQQLVTAGAGSSVYASEQLALNAVNEGLFYVEKELKDLKLAIPFGLSVDCPAARCPDRVESRYSGLSTEHLRTNLAAFRQLFQGCGEANAGIGFDDWLLSAGYSDLAARMLAALDSAEAEAGALDLPLDRLVVEQPERVQVVYDAVKALTDLLKTEFVTALNLELPMDSIGDND